MLTVGEAEEQRFNVGAQNCSAYDKGAYTGEVSAKMLKSLEVDYCIVGHSERRKYFGETNEVLAEKINRLSENNMSPIYCVGEVLEEREAGRHFEVVKEQLEKEGKPMPVLKEKPKAEDDDVETDKIPYYLAYFNHAFELEPLYKRMYFNEGHVPEEMREIYKYKNKDIPAYRKLFRQLQAYEARQREIPQDTNEENSADSTAE